MDPFTEVKDSRSHDRHHCREHDEGQQVDMLLAVSTFDVKTHGLASSMGTTDQFAAESGGSAAEH
jgi:hypothetical protein